MVFLGTSDGRTIIAGCVVGVHIHSDPISCQLILEAVHHAIIQATGTPLVSPICPETSDIAVNMQWVNEELSSRPKELIT